MPSPMNRPTKTVGSAAGSATRSTRSRSSAPSVRATSKYDLPTLPTPDDVITVTGNQAASAIRKTLAEKLVGNATIAIGIHAVEGIGPMARTSGDSQ